MSNFPELSKIICMNSPSYNTAIYKISVIVL